MCISIYFFFNFSKKLIKKTYSSESSTTGIKPSSRPCNQLLNTGPSKLVTRFSKVISSSVSLTTIEQIFQPDMLLKSFFHSQSTCFSSRYA